jgi:hypothetical protein
MSGTANPLSDVPEQTFEFAERLALYLLIDTSGSMMGDKYRLMREQLQSTILSRLPDTIACGIVSFGINIFPELSKKVGDEVYEVLAIAGSNRDEVVNVIRAMPETLDNRGNTPLYSAILYALNRLESMTPLKRSIIVFTDGEATDGKRLEDVRKRAIPLKLNADLAGLMMFALGLGILPDALKEFIADIDGFSERIDVESGPRAAQSASNFLQKTMTKVAETGGVSQKIDALQVQLFSLKLNNENRNDKIMSEIIGLNHKFMSEIADLKETLRLSTKRGTKRIILVTFLAIACLIGFLILKVDVESAVIQERFRILDTLINR